jgi:uncharacterized repeat protein (TIGR02543 family)
MPHGEENARKPGFSSRPAEALRGAVSSGITLFLALLVGVTGVVVPLSPVYAAGATVVFDSNGGVGEMQPQVSAGPAALDANTFTRENFRFDGWNTDRNGSGTRYGDGATYDFSADVTLFAQWVVVGFVVTFNANGGEGSMAAQIATTPTSLTQNAFTWADRNFLGWNTAADGSGQEFADGATHPFGSSGSQVLYAQWSEAPTRTVTFNANGGSGVMASQEANEPSALDTVAFTRANFVFTGWNSQANGLGASYSNSEVYDFSADLTLYAQWAPIQTFSVTFNANGGSGAMSTQTSSSPASLSPNTFTRPNFAFVGWALTSSGGAVYADQDVYDFDADITLFARWSSAVTVTFNPNSDDALGSMAAQSVGANTILRPNAYTREGFAFSHWNTAANGSGTSYPDGWAGPLLSAGLTLFAQWVPVTAEVPTVRFNANGGSGTLMAPQQASTPSALTANTFSPPANRAFLSWNTAPDGSGESFNNQATFPFTESTVLYAQWGFRISMARNGGVLADTGIAADTFVVVRSPGLIPASPFQRTGHVFVGWASVANPAVNTVWYSPGESIALSTTLSLHAQWAPASPGEQAVAFVANSGTSSTSYRVTQTSAEAANLQLNAFTRGGHTFSGWSTSRTSSVVSYPNGATYPFTESRLLWAVWSQNAVTFDANGGSGSLARQTSTASTSLRFNGPSDISRSGHVFVGWNTAPDGSGQAYAQQAWYPFASPEQTLTLYAQWEPIPDDSSKVVSFSANGATSGFMAPQRSDGETTLRPNTFTRTGYQFAGWRTAANSGTVFPDESAWPFSSNQTLYAQWTPLVTFHANGGTGANYTQEVTESPLTLVPNSFTRTGHKFLGWATSSGGSPVFTDSQRIVVNNGSITNTGALSLFARWQSVVDGQSLVTYVSNYSTNSITSQASTSPTALTGNFSRNGFTLLGWARSATGGVEFERGEVYNFGADLTLFAVWEQNKVIFDANGGAGSMAEQTGTAAATLRSNAFSRTGFAFDGWATSPGGSIAYSEGSSYPFNTPNRSATLYARWVALPGYEIVDFAPNGGTGSMSLQSVVNGGTVTFAPNRFSREGHTFIGWNTAADGTGTEFPDGQSISLNSSFTLYAQWIEDSTIQNQTVTFMPNLGTGSMDPQTVFGRTALTSNTFTRENAIFTGWNTQEDGLGIGYADNSQIFIQQEVTLYAQWLVLGANTVALEFRANGGSGSPIAPLTGSPETTVTLPGNTFSRPGFEFVGWNTDVAGGLATRLQPESSYSLSSENAVLYAEWVQVWRSVIFDANGGSGTMLTQTSDRTQNLTLNGFTRERFSFTGWATEPDGSGDTFTNGASFSFSDDMTLYAQWQQTLFTVTFDANGGSGVMASQTAPSTATLTGNSFTRSNHRFLGWSTDQSATSPEFANGASYSFAADATLYAVWEPVFVVSFDANGGTGTMATQSASTSTPLSLNAFTREGWTFTGWNTQANGLGVGFGDGARYPFTTSQTLYAQWTPTTYTVTFNSNGAPGSMSSQVSAAPAPLTASTLTRTGHVFRGWSTSANATTATFLDQAVFPFTQNTILYAVWSPIFTVTYNANGGVGSMATSRSADPQSLRPNAFSRVGFAFAGWNTQADGSGTSFGNGAVFPFSQNQTLFAQWTQTTFTVTFDANGGIGSMSAQSGEGPGALSRNLFSRPGFVFAGWTLDGSGSNLDYADQGSFSFSSDVTLFAVWLPAFTITFDANGGSGVTATQEGRGSTALAGSTYTRPGFRFVGWGEDSGGLSGTLSPGSQINLTQNITLFAIWEANSATQRPQSRPPTPPQATAEVPSSGVAAVSLPPRLPLTPAATPGPQPTINQSPSRPPTPSQPNLNDSRPGQSPGPISPRNTIDLGQGVGESTTSSAQVSNEREQATRTLRQLVQERLGGFSPTSTLTIEVSGARTTARFVVSSLTNLDSLSLAERIAQSAATEAASFVQIVSVTPGRSSTPPAMSGELNQSEVDQLFSRARLDSPQWLGDLETAPDMTWVTVSMTGETYVPGSVVYLTVTSDPIILAKAQVNSFGKVDLVGSVPLEVLGVGEHRFRLVGTRSFDGVGVDEDGTIVLPDPVLESIQEFDRGTDATIVVAGKNETGGVHQAVRVIPLDTEKPWWTLWLIVWTGLLLVLGRALGKIGKPGEQIGASALVLVSTGPALYFGWTMEAPDVALWGAVIGCALSALLWAVPNFVGVRNAQDVSRQPHRVKRVVAAPRQAQST